MSQREFTPFSGSGHRLGADGGGDQQQQQIEPDENGQEQVPRDALGVAHDTVAVTIEEDEPIPDGLRTDSAVEEGSDVDGSASTAPALIDTDRAAESPASLMSMNETLDETATVVCAKSVEFAATRHPYMRQLQSDLDELALELRLLQSEVEDRLGKEMEIEIPTPHTEGYHGRASLLLGRWEAMREVISQATTQTVTNVESQDAASILDGPVELVHCSVDVEDGTLIVAETLEDSVEAPPETGESGTKRARR